MPRDIDRCGHLLTVVSPSLQTRGYLRHVQSAGKFSGLYRRPLPFAALHLSVCQKLLFHAISLRDYCRTVTAVYPLQYILLLCLHLRPQKVVKVSQRCHK